MDVQPDHRRRGIGTALLAAVSNAARHAGAHHTVLNATPIGKRLYTARGYHPIGEGITWWHHMGA